MTPIASLTNELTRLVGVGQKDIDRLRELKEGVLGWSALAHYITFRELLKAKPNARILVCGVYHGLDLRYLAGIAEDLGQKPTLVGVDLFSDGPCADWPEDKRGLPWMEARTWEGAGEKITITKPHAQSGMPSLRFTAQKENTLLEKLG